MSTSIQAEKATARPGACAFDRFARNANLSRPDPLAVWPGHGGLSANMRKTLAFNGRPPIDPIARIAGDATSHSR
jgi:hypothetical protein